MFSQADAYERFMGRWSQRLAPLLVEFADVRDGDEVLDVGSGTGSLSFAAEAAGARVTGVEASQAYIDYAGQHATDRVRFEVGDAVALPYPDGVFDKTLSLLVLNFLPDPAAALREMNRITHPDGLVAAAVWDYGRGMQMLRTFWDEAVALTPNAPDERHMPLTTQGALTALWQAQGLRDVEERPLTIAMDFSSFDDYWQPFLGRQGPAGAHVASLTDSTRQALQDRLRARLGNPRGAFTLQATAWAVRGVVTAAPSRTSSRPGAQR